MTLRVISIVPSDLRIGFWLVSYAYEDVNFVEFYRGKDELDVYAQFMKEYREHGAKFVGNHET